MLNPDRYFDPAPAVRDLARELYGRAARLPLVCPHGHVDPRILAENTPFPDPAALLVIPDHYVTRMLYSQGVPLEALGVPSLDGTPVETDSRRIWRRFAEHMPLFRGTPSGCWLRHELADVFGIDEPLDRPQRRRRLRPHRRAAAHRRVPAARPVRAVPDRGALHHRLGHRHARLAPADPRLGLERRGPADVPPGPGDQHPAPRLAGRDGSPRRR